MRVVRGRAATPTADRDVTAAMLERTASTGVAAFRAWTPHRQVAFGRRDAHEDGYADARAAAERSGYPPLERSVGGRAVAYSGTTLAFAHACPIDDVRRGLDERYDDAVEAVLTALATLGVDAERGEPPNAFCPGDHSVRCGGKLVGVAQRVTSGAALVSGCVVVADRAELAAVLDDVYRALGLPFDPASVGSVAAAGGPSSPGAVRDALEAAFVDGDPESVAAASLVADHDT